MISLLVVNGEVAHAATGNFTKEQLLEIQRKKSFLPLDLKESDEVSVVRKIFLAFTGIEEDDGVTWSCEEYCLPDLEDYFHESELLELRASVMLEMIKSDGFYIVDYQWSSLSVLHYDAAVYPFSLKDGTTVGSESLTWWIHWHEDVPNRYRVRHVASGEIYYEGKNLEDAKKVIEKEDQEEIEKEYGGDRDKFLDDIYSGSILERVCEFSAEDGEPDWEAI